MINLVAMLKIDCRKQTYCEIIKLIQVIHTGDAWQATNYTAIVESKFKLWIWKKKKRSYKPKKKKKVNTKGFHDGSVCVGYKKSRGVKMTFRLLAWAPKNIKIILLGVLKLSSYKGRKSRVKSWPGHTWEVLLAVKVGRLNRQLGMWIWTINLDIWVI